MFLYKKFLKAGTTDEQYVFILVKMVPESSLKRSALSLMLVLDKSGSMGEYVGSMRKIDVAVGSGKQLLGYSALNKSDNIGFIGFDHRSTVIIPHLI